MGIQNIQELNYCKNCGQMVTAGSLLAAVKC